MTEYHLNIKRISQDTAGIVILELSGLRNEPLFDFKPGQYVMISYKNENGLTADKHAFSIASSPVRNTSIRLGIKVGGSFTQGLLNLRIGQTITVAGPYGRFIFNENKIPHPVFIAGGIGITPFISSLNYAADKMLPNKIQLIYSVRNREAAAFLEEIGGLQAKNPNLSVLLCVTEESGRLTAERLQDFIGNVDKKTFYLCGPAPFMTTTADNLRILGVAKKQIKTEAFAMIPDQGFWAVFRNLAYAASFAAALFLPIFYFINNNAKIAQADKAGGGTGQTNITTSVNQPIEAQAPPIIKVVNQPVNNQPMTIPKPAPRPRTMMS